MANLIARYRHITFFMTLLTLIVVMVGAYTRLSDAGLGCPDWPGCYGSMIVQEGTIEPDKAWIEMIHRYIAGTLGLFVFGLTLISFIQKREGVLYHIRGLLVFTSILITFQALLGMWTVTKLLHPTIVMLHLLGGMATLSMVWLAHLRLQNPPVETAAPFAKGAKIASVVGLFIVIYSNRFGWLGVY